MEEGQPLPPEHPKQPSVIRTLGTKIVNLLSHDPDPEGPDPNLGERGLRSAGLAQARQDEQIRRHNEVRKP